VAGDEVRLLDLAQHRDLPNLAGAAVLEGLAVADTAEVREYLLNRLLYESNPELFAAAAKGAARLREARAVATIGEQLLARREGWQGVAPHLARALERIGGDAAQQLLAQFRAPR
jgi:hypothetical protein